MKFEDIKSFDELSQKISDIDRSYLLLYKSGSEQSDCAVKNIERISEQDNDKPFFKADVSFVRDIHERYQITSVPTLIEFQGNKLKQVIKGCHEPEFLKSYFDDSLYSVTNKPDEKKAKRVVVYTTPTCPHCTTLKNYLKNNGIQYRDINVAQDQKMAEAMVKKSGQQGVPQIEINGKIVVGFNKPKIDELLEIK